MIPSSDVIESAWWTLTGLLFGMLLGGLGVRLLSWSVWQWLIGRTRVLRTLDGTMLTVPQAVGGAPETAGASGTNNEDLLTESAKYLGTGPPAP